jgi:hypothetical protein
MLFRELAEISYNQYCASDDEAYCNNLRGLHIDRDSLLLFAASRISQKTLDLLGYNFSRETYKQEKIKKLAGFIDIQFKLQVLYTADKIALLTAYHSLQERMAIMPFYLQRDVRVEDIVKEVTISKIMLAFNKAIVLLSNNEPFPEDDIEYQLAERLAYQVAPSLMQSLAYSNDIKVLQELCIISSLCIVQANSLMPSLLRAQELSKVLLITEGLSKIQLDKPKYEQQQNLMSYVANIAFEACINCYNFIKICMGTLIDIVDKYILSPAISFAQGVVRYSNP